MSYRGITYALKWSVAHGLLSTPMRKSFVIFNILFFSLASSAASDLKETKKTETNNLTTAMEPPPATVSGLNSSAKSTSSSRASCLFVCWFVCWFFVFFCFLSLLFVCLWLNHCHRLHCHFQEWGRRSRGATVRLESLGEVILFAIEILIMEN